MMTELGKQTFELVCRYDLGKYYQAEVGNLVFRPEELTVEVTARIMKFLRRNHGWVMGYEFDGDEYYAYVTPIEFLADCHGFTQG